MAGADAAREKPATPYPTFPLTPYANGQWCKNIRGKVDFFGVSDRDAKWGGCARPVNGSGLGARGVLATSNWLVPSDLWLRRIRSDEQSAPHALVGA